MTPPDRQSQLETKLPIRIVCRTDIDWTALARVPTLVDGVRSLPRPGSATPAFLEFLESLERGHVLDRWDDAYGMDFVSFRAALSRIAAANVSSVRGARISVGLTDFSAWYGTDDDEMIYPIDDDDYFHPELATTAPDRGSDTAIVFWPHLVYTYDAEGSPTLMTREVRTLLTNNWAVRKSFLRDNFSEEEARRVLQNHAKAAWAIARVLGVRLPRQDEKWHEVELRAPGAAYLPDSYGLSLIHVGSLLRLRNLRDGGSAPALRLDGAARVPSELAWVEPWIRLAEDVFRGLHR